MGSTYGLEIYTSVAKGLKLEDKVLEANSNACRSYIKKVVGVRGMELFAPKILNRVKWIEMGGFFWIELQKTAPFNYLYLSYAWEVNQLNYPFELGLLISHTLHFQEYLTPQII